MIMREGSPRIEKKVWNGHDVMLWDVTIIHSEKDIPKFIHTLEPIRGMKGSALEIGLGLGTSARLVDEMGNFSEHIIIEKHKEVIDKMANGFNCVCADYRDWVKDCGKKFDFILYDPWPYDDDYKEILKPVCKDDTLIIRLQP